MTILCDLTEFLMRPKRTGIQRVSFEIVSRWQGSVPLTPVCLSGADQFVRLPGECFELMQAFFQADDEEQLRRAQTQIQNLVRHPRATRLKNLKSYQALFTPEVFFCRDRIAAYGQLAEGGGIEVFLVVYDFLPWIEPGFFQQEMPLGTYPYFRLLRSIPNLAYISEWSRQVAQERVFRDRRPAGVTIPLGADGLGSAPPVFDADLREFTVVGTIEPRKGHLKILDAFENLWRAGHAIPLTFVGRPGWLSDRQLRRIERLKHQQPLFTWLDNLTDPQVAEVVKKSRATIYVSEHEGFGLPPVESLSLGTPAIVASKIPSVEMIPPLGQTRLDDPTPAAIQAAVLELMDDARARRVTEEIAGLDLLTWDASSKRYSDWIEERLQAKGRRSDAA